jgi:hypothetical protein
VKDYYNGGTTYKNLCSDNTEPVCANNYFTEIHDNPSKYFSYYVGGIDYTFNVNTGFSTHYSDTNIPYVYNKDLNMIEFYHDGMYIDNIDICKFLNDEGRTNYCQQNKYNQSEFNNAE